MKQLEVQIMGQSYILTCPEDGQEHLHAAVLKVDEAMCKIRDLGKVKARDRIAVLAVLNLTFELMQSLAIATYVPEPPPAPEPPPVPEPLPAPEVPPVQQAPSQPLPRIDEVASKAPHPQLQTLLQRIDTALGTNTRSD